MSTKKKPSKRYDKKASVLPPKPPLLPDELAALFRNSDYIGIEYYNCDQIRRRKKKTPEQAKRLAEHDAEEARIQREPEGMMREAHQAIDRGTSLLLKLIRSGKLAHTTEPTEKGIAEGVRPWRHDSAIECFCSRLSYFNRELVRLAEDNAPHGCWHLWYEAKVLTEAVTRLALVYPEEFRPMAETSLLMPSLRARNPKFTSDADAISKAIHLAEKHPTPNIWDNNTRAGALCHLMVTKILENIHFARWQYESERTTLEGLKEFRETAAKYRNVTLEQSLESHLYPRLFTHVMACAALPDWKEGAAAWWKGRVLPLIKDEFAQLAKNPKHNAALWNELKNGGERNTEKDMRRYMEKLCKNKFDQIVKDCP